MGFRVTTKVGGDLRYKNSGSLLLDCPPWRRQHGMPTLEEEGSVLEITLDHEAGTVAFRAPELWNRYLGTVRIKEDDPGTVELQRR